MSKDVAIADKRIKHYYDCSAVVDEDSCYVLMDDRMRTFVVPPS